MLLITVLKYLKMYNESRHNNLTEKNKYKLSLCVTLIESVLSDLDKQGYNKEWNNEKI